MNRLLMIALLYLGVMNLVAFVTFGIDKYKAGKGRWRIPESRLLRLALLGGSVGAWLGMKVWHHKTLHKKFKYGLPAILFLHLLLAGAVAYVVFYKTNI